MKTLLNKNIFILCCLALLISIVVSCYGSQDEKQSNNLSPAALNEPKNDAITTPEILFSHANSSTATEIINNEKIDTSDYQTVMGNAQNKAEIKDWFFSRGYYYRKNSIDEYAGYEDSTLQSLADGGDVRAMMHYDGTSEGFKRSRDIYIKAAIYGSTAALEAISRMTGSH